MNGERSVRLKRKKAQENDESPAENLSSEENDRMQWTAGDGEIEQAVSSDGHPLEENSVRILSEECHVLEQELEDLMSFLVEESPKKSNDYRKWLLDKEQKIKSKIELLQDSDPISVSNEYRAVEIDWTDDALVAMHQVRECHESLLKQRCVLDDDIESEKKTLEQLEAESSKLEQLLKESSKHVENSVDLDEAIKQISQLRECLRNDESEVKEISTEFLRKISEFKEGSDCDERSVSNVIEELIRVTESPKFPYVTVKNSPHTEYLLRAGIIQRHGSIPDKIKLC